MPIIHMRTRGAKMNKVDVFSLINSRYNSFTNTEKKVADYILGNTKDAIYMSIIDLADACGVGESSVFRFCRSLDFKGYQDFKIALAHSSAMEDITPQLSNEITIEDGIDEVSTKILNSNINALNETRKLIKEDDISTAIDYLTKAESIHFYGVGASLMTAMEGKIKFMRITPKTECSLDSHLQVISASLLTKKDVAIIVSYSGSTKDSIDLAKTAKRKGAKVIAITRYSKSPITTYADITLLCGAKEGPLQGGSLSAKLAQLYLLDVLYVEYFRRNYKESSKNRESTSSVVINKLL